MKKLKIVTMILALMLLLISSVSATVSNIDLTPLMAEEDTAYIGAVTADTDDTITEYSIEDGPAWLEIDDETGDLSGTPATDDIGDNEFTIGVTDGGGQETADFTIEVVEALTITDVSPLEATEDADYTGTVTVTGGITPLTYSLTGGPSWLGINEDTGALSGIPLEVDIGPNYFEVTVEGGNGNDDTEDFTIDVLEFNDMPIVYVSECTEDNGIEGVEYKCTVSATDEEDDEEDLILRSSKGTVTAGTLIWTPNEDDIGLKTINVYAKDTLEKEGIASFTVFIRPNEVCGDWTGGSDIKIAMDILDDDEDFYPGDNIEIDVEVENENNEEDIQDIEVEAILYDITDGKRLYRETSDDFDLDAKDDKEVEVILEIPKDVTTKNHDFIVFVSAYEDGNDENNCDWERDNFDIKRRKHDVNIEKVLVDPSTVKAGKTVDVRVDVENVGTSDEKDVYVRVKNGDLGIDEKSQLFEVEDYEKGDDDEYSVTITIEIPEDAESGDYDLEIQIYDDDDEIYESGAEWKTLYVEGTGTGSTPGTTPTGTATVTTEGTPEEVEQGESFSIPVKITNTADEDKEYKITISNIGDWADSTSEFDVYLKAGQTSTYYITVTPDEDAAEGKHSATINVKEGTSVVSTKTLSFTIPETEVSGITGGTVADVDAEGDGFFNNLFSGTTLWIIGDLLLVVVAIFFIRMLFSKKS